ncbi:MAG TPA: hypothetical protein VHC98_01380 [Candidatus Saccharimonadales bacterium]|nr:hypothetical protein [Candidatus Saccharimonadales bacterium]
MPLHEQTQHEIEQLNDVLDDLTNAFGEGVEESGAYQQYLEQLGALAVEAENQGYEFGQISKYSV